MNAEQNRKESFGVKKLSRLDKLIYTMRVRSIKKYCDCKDKTIMDVGCGYNADFLRYIQKKYIPSKAIAYDLMLNKPFLEQENIACIEWDLNMPLQLDGTVDFIFATAILEHLSAPIPFLRECLSKLAPGWCLLVTTPSIWSKPVLEFMAYKLKVISAEEIEDHKEYFDKAILLDYYTKAGFDVSRVHHEYFECYMNNLIVAHKK